MIFMVIFAVKNVQNPRGSTASQMLNFHFSQPQNKL